MPLLLVFLMASNLALGSYDLTIDLRDSYNNDFKNNGHVIAELERIESGLIEKKIKSSEAKNILREIVYRLPLWESYDLSINDNLEPLIADYLLITEFLTTVETLERRSLVFPGFRTAIANNPVQQSEILFGELQKVREQNEHLKKILEKANWWERLWGRYNNLKRETDRADFANNYLDRAPAELFSEEPPAVIQSLTNRRARYFLEHALYPSLTRLAILEKRKRR